MRHAVPIPRVIALCAAIAAVALAPDPGTADADDGAAWRAAASSIFRVFTVAPGFPFACTGWYLAPAPGRAPVSVYVTAGHCPTPLLVRTNTWYEDTLVIARIHSTDAGADLTIAKRSDPRADRVFLPLADAAPAPGERAIVVGYGGGTLTEIAVTTASSCQRPFLCFDSPAYIEGGLSGSPIISPVTGRVLGILVASPERTSPGGPYTVIATPAAAVRAAVGLALPALSLPSTIEGGHPR